MLTHLEVHNLAVIDHLAVSFGEKLNVLTGETGAGKSILVDALKLALGQRSDNNKLKDPQQKGEVTAIFDITHKSAVKQWLDEQDLDTDDECVCRRVLRPNQASRCYINQSPVPLSLMRELADSLTTIHSQHQNQALTQYSAQRVMVDNYGGHHELVEQIQNAFESYRQARRELTSMEQTLSDRENRLQLVDFQVQELSELGLQEGELAELENEHKKLAHAKDLVYHYNNALNLLTEDDRSTSAQLHSVLHQLQQAGHYTDNERLRNLVSIVEGAQIQINEAKNELEHELASMTFDPDRLDYLQNRLSRIHEIARKHRVEPEALPRRYQQLLEEQTRLHHLDQQLTEQQQRVKELEKHYVTLARELSAKRQQAGDDLADKLSRQLHDLAMPHAKAWFERVPNQHYSPYGLEQMRLIIQTNPGHKAQPLHQIASGGELSRISLALRVLVHGGLASDSFIFDEVDVGIGGQTASIVGQMLQKLSETGQVLCITHLPQVACFGHHHYQVRKYQQAQATQFTIRPLDQTNRIEELARMLGGMQITEQSRAHARELLGLSAQNPMYQD